MRQVVGNEDNTVDNCNISREQSCGSTDIDTNTNTHLIRGLPILDQAFGRTGQIDSTEVEAEVSGEGEENVTFELLDSEGQEVDRFSTLMDSQQSCGNSFSCDVEGEGQSLGADDTNLLLLCDFDFSGANNIPDFDWETVPSSII